MDYSIENVTHIVQKVRQANWRVQRQWIGLFLLGLVAVSMVAGIYLNITVRATLAGRQIQALQSQLIDERQNNSDLETQMAGLTSVSSMQQRAEAMGFAPAEMGDITYVMVPGYKPLNSVDMSKPISADNIQNNTPVLPPSYTESLFDWISRKLISSGTSGVYP